MNIFQANVTRQAAQQFSSLLISALDPQPTLLLLWLTLANVALTLLFCAIDAVANPKAHVLIHGDVSTSSTVRQRTRRARFWALISRILSSALIIASMLPAAQIALPFYRSRPLSSLAPFASNQWMHSLMRRTLLHYAQTNPTQAALAKVTVGLSERLLTPSSLDPNQSWTYRFLLALIAALSILGLLWRLIPSRLLTRRLVAPFILLHPLIWILVSVPAAYVRPNVLPMDSSPLSAKWLDFVYHTEPNKLDEDRFLMNWYVQTLPSPAAPEPISKFQNISRSFCNQFNALLESAPSTAASNTARVSSLSSSILSVAQLADSASITPDPRTVPMTPLTFELARDALIVYTVGKPTRADQLRAIAYTGLAATAAAPIAVAQSLTTYFLYPLALFWMSLFIIFALLVTPSVIRPISAPFDEAQVITFCTYPYRIQVVDATTKLIMRVDVAIFAVTILAAMLQGYRWVNLSGDHEFSAQAAMPSTPKDSSNGEDEKSSGVADEPEKQAAP